jgi:hypothetical protein
MLLQGSLELELLARSAGFQAMAADGDLGIVETPLFPPDAAVPDFLVLRVSGGLRKRRPIVSAALVDEIDYPRRLVRFRGSREELERLPEQLPLAL